MEVDVTVKAEAAVGLEWSASRSADVILLQYWRRPVKPSSQSQSNPEPARAKARRESDGGES